MVAKKTKRGTHRIDPQTGEVRVNFRVPREWLADLDELAAIQDRPRTIYLRYVIMTALDARDTQGAADFRLGQHSTKRRAKTR